MDAQRPSTASRLVALERKMNLQMKTGIMGGKAAREANAALVLQAANASVSGTTRATFSGWQGKAYSRYVAVAAGQRCAAVIRLLAFLLSPVSV